MRTSSVRHVRRIVRNLIVHYGIYGVLDRGLTNLHRFELSKLIHPKIRIHRYHTRGFIIPNHIPRDVVDGTLMIHITHGIEGHGFLT